MSKSNNIVTIYMPEDTLEKVDKARERESRSRSNFICKVVLDYIAEQEGD